MSSRMSIVIALVLLTCCVGRAQEATPVDDWKPSTINQKGKEYPQVNSERRARFLQQGSRKGTSNSSSTARNEDGLQVGGLVFHFG